MANIFARGSRERAPIALLAKCEPLFVSLRSTRALACGGSTKIIRDGVAVPYYFVKKVKRNTKLKSNDRTFTLVFQALPCLQ